MGLSEDTKLFEEMPVINKGPAWDLIGKTHLEECPRRKPLSDMASMSRICILAVGGTFQEAQEMRMCLMNMEEGRGGNTKISKEKLLPLH